MFRLSLRILRDRSVDSTHVQPLPQRAWQEGTSSRRRWKDPGPPRKPRVVFLFFVFCWLPFFGIKSKENKDVLRGFRLGFHDFLKCVSVDL